MVSKRVRFAIPQGMHMRPAQVLSAGMTRFDSSVTIMFGGKTINAKSVINLMASCITMGSEIEIRCEGPQEAEALREAVRLVESGLGDL